MKNQIIHRDDDTEYGVALNGRQVGNGYDVFIKRESERTALINIMTPNRSKEWLAEIELDDCGLNDVMQNDMQLLACHIGQGPQVWMHYSPEDDYWEELAARWDAIIIR